IALQAAADEKRDAIMSLNDSLHLVQLKEAVQHYYAELHRPITYEYLLFDEFNDSPSDARQLAEIVHWAPSKVNIIMYNDVAGVALKRTSEKRLDAFMLELVDQYVTD